MAKRPRVPHTQAEHMGAPTNAANVKKVLANSEPSTHGGKADIFGWRRTTARPQGVGAATYNRR
jgi:hypothetical protein